MADGNSWLELLLLVYKCVYPAANAAFELDELFPKEWCLLLSPIDCDFWMLVTDEEDFRFCTIECLSRLLSLL